MPQKSHRSQTNDIGGMQSVSGLLDLGGATALLGAVRYRNSDAEYGRAMIDAGSLFGWLIRDKPAKIIVWPLAQTSVSHRNPRRMR